MPLSWDREYDLPDDEPTDAEIAAAAEEDALISQIIAHDVEVAGRNFLRMAEGDFDPGDEDDDDDFDDDYIYVDDDDDGTNDDFDDEPEYNPMIDGGTDSDDGDPKDIDDGYGDEAILPHGVTMVSYRFITSLNE